ncbi:hypothetical protein EBR96_08025 [bacterium]|nr:hypothetical protein [bacterium]
MRIRLTGTISANIIVTVPAIGGRWTFTNSTSGSFTVTIASAGAGTSVVITQGYSTTLYSDGTNIALADDGLLNSLTSLNLSGTLAVAGTTTLSGATTLNATATLNGSASTLAAIFKNAAEPVSVSATSATGTINFDILTQSVVYYTANASGNFTINVRGNGSTTFNTITSNNQVITLVFLSTNGSTAYYNSAVQIDGVAQTVKWQSGNAPTTGNANAVDIYTYTIIKTASATYTVFASQTQFA